MSKYVEDTMKNSSSMELTCSLAVAAVSGACRSLAMEKFKVLVRLGSIFKGKAYHDELSNALPSSFVVSSCGVRACCTGSYTEKGRIRTSAANQVCSCALHTCRC